jgi:hypothetical protein
LSKIFYIDSSIDKMCHCFQWGECKKSQHGLDDDNAIGILEYEYDLEKSSYLGNGGSLPAAISNGMGSMSVMDSCDTVVAVVVAIVEVVVVFGTIVVVVAVG